MIVPAKVDWKSSSHPISDIRDWSRANRLEMQPEFQRNQVWSKAAKIMLIDTILRNIPMPKIFLQGILRKGDTYRIVIDGQQRLTAILEFLNDGFALDTPYDGQYRLKRFSELPAQIQDEILNYNVDINERLCSRRGLMKSIVRVLQKRGRNIRICYASLQCHNWQWCQTVRPLASSACRFDSVFCREKMVYRPASFSLCLQKQNQHFQF